MTAKGHVALAFPFGVLGSTALGLNGIESSVFVFLVSLSALAPDVDEPGSWIGRRLWFLSWTIKILSIFFPTFKHRGVTHLLAVPLAIFIIGYLIGNVWIIGIAIGWFAHTLGDLITAGGIIGYFYPFWPEKRIRLMSKYLPIYTGGFVEYLIILVLMVVDIKIYLQYVNIY